MARAESRKERLPGIFVNKSQPGYLEHSTQFTNGGFETSPEFFMHLLN